MSAAYADIASLLARARRRRTRLVLLAALGAGLGAALASTLAGSAALHLGVRTGLARWPALAVAGAALLLAIGWAALALRRVARTPEATARALAAADPALRSALVSAVELTRERGRLAESGAASVAFVDAHVARTAEAIQRFDLAAAIPARLARRAGLALAGVSLLTGLVLLTGGAPLRSAYGRVLAGDPVAAAAPSLDPITGDIELTYRYPAYTRRDPRTVSGTGGEIRAPKGTEVELRTRADRPVEAAELEVSVAAAAAPVAATSAVAGGSTAPVRPAAPAVSRLSLAIANRRDLSGRLVVGDGGSYRFRFRTGSGRVVAEGPPIPVIVEPDAFPTVRITSPAAELEVKPDAVVRIDWQAEDDSGLTGLTLVTRSASGPEKRRPVRTLTGVRRDAGTLELALAPEQLGEGERLLYWLEVTDDDTVSGPKKGASATQVLKRYSEAEHRRLALERARAAWEELVALLGDRLELFAQGPVATPARLPLAGALDARARATTERLRETARALRKDRAAPPELAPALENVAASLRTAEQRCAGTRAGVARLLGNRVPVDGGPAQQLAAVDQLMDQALEKGVLYLEQLFDKARAEDLLRMARDLAERRRELARALEKVRDAPSTQAKQQALAQLQRLRERMKELMARMAETARGFHDEHMNAEAMAELGKQKDMLSGLDAAEKALEKGDVAAAMKALEEMSAQLDQLTAGLEKTAQVPDASQRELMQEMQTFKKELDQVEAEQQRVAGETERIRAAQRQRQAEALEKAGPRTQALEQLAAEAKQALQKAQAGLPDRSEPDYEAAQEAISDLQRALALKDLDAAQEMTQRAQAPATRVAMTAEEEASLAERLPGATRKDPATLRQAQGKAREAAQKLAQVGRELQRLQPDPQRATTPTERGKLDQLSREQAVLERRAGGLQQKLGELMQKAPVFPQGAPQLLGESRGHMGAAAGELGQKNAQRGHGEQEAALERLGRFRQGLEQMAKKGGGQGGGFPFPFGEQDAGQREGEGEDPSQEKVEIPGAEAHRLPEAFRRDLMEAMKQGAPERYRGEVQRYYEELVK
jgi:Domain of unknown function (DUF4175)